MFEGPSDDIMGQPQRRLMTSFQFFSQCPKLASLTRAGDILIQIE